MRSTPATIDWYRNNEVWPGEIGFDPDGMCMKICRTARGAPSRYPSALASQQATPLKYRVHKIIDIRAGMLGYFDDPHDSNPFGHVVTWVGRLPNTDHSKLSSLLCRTNAVKTNQIVVVRGDYFQQHWGDEFQFAGTWISGAPITEFNKEPAPKPKKKESKHHNIQHAIADLQDAERWNRKHGHKRIANALERDIASLRKKV
jgi:hypothetical protein